MSLIRYINANKGALLPDTVKSELRNQLAGRKNLRFSEARKVLLNWAVWAMPIIAEKHKVANQAIDSLQHYRFGFVQAERLIKRSGAPKLSSDDLETLNLFNSVHDMGRLMVGSGASKDEYGEQGSLLHPIVGALMLREAFDPIAVEANSDLTKLFRALVMTTERHTMSFGLSPSVVEKYKIHTIAAEPYYGFKGSLFLADVEMGSFTRCAHLVALADLINNVDQKLFGVYSYDPLEKKAKDADPQQRIDYMMRGPGDGEFSVQKTEDGETLRVNRLWKNGKYLQEKNADFNSWLKVMEDDALKYTSPDEKPRAKEVFWEGIRKANLLV
jgi:hypothetical protein